MARQRSHAQLSIIINGHRLVGFAEEDQPYEFEWPDLADINTGADGGKYGRAISDFGCGFMVRLADVSASLQWAIDQRTLHMNAVRTGAPIPEHRATITDLAFGISGSMQGGWIANIPGWPPAAGNMAELSFGFELWTPTVQGGAFQASVLLGL